MELIISYNGSRKPFKRSKSLCFKTLIGCGRVLVSQEARNCNVIVLAQRKQEGVVTERREFIDAVAGGDSAVSLYVQENRATTCAFGQLSCVNRPEQGSDILSLTCCVSSKLHGFRHQIFILRFTYKCIKLFCNPIYFTIFRQFVPFSVLTL